jgi:hypothetical protein
VTARGIAIAVIAAGVIAGGVALAIAVNADVADPEAKARDKVDTTAPPATSARPAPSAPPAPSPAKPVPLAAGSASAGEKHPIPAGGFAAWTGREGLAPGEIEEMARISGIRVPLALEQRRASLLEERTVDPAVLGQVLGQDPTGFMLATIGTQGKLLRDALMQARLANRQGKLSDDEAIRATRAAEDVYRATYQRVTGLTDAQFDQFFAPDRPLP